MKLDLLTNATVVDDASKFVELLPKQKLLSKESSEESKESVDYNDRELA